MLIVLGVALGVLELFIPSAGVLAALSIASIIAGVVVGFLSGPLVGLGVLVTVIVGLPAGMVVAVKWWPHTPIGRRILLRVGNSEEMKPDDDFHRGLKALIGCYGEARSKMLPSGAIVIDGKTIDAFSEGVPIEPGQRVVVLDVQGTMVLVRPVDDDEVPPPAEVPGEMSQPIDSIAPDPFSDETA